MNIFGLTCFITGISASIFGLFVFFKEKKQILNQLWFLFNLSIAIWTMGLGGTFVVNNPADALICQIILYIGTIFIPPLFLQFCLVLLRRNKEKKFVTLFRINLFLVIIFILSLFFKDFFIKGIKPKTLYGYWPVEVGWLYYPFLFWFAFNIIYAFSLLRKSLREQKELDILRRKQISIIFYAGLIGFSAGSLNFLLDFNIVFPPFHNLFVISYLFFTALAILRYHLFGIKVILTELLVGVMEIILLVQIFLAQTFTWRISSGFTFLLFSIFAYFLIKATHEEAKRREEAEKIAIQERVLRRKSEKLAKEFERLDRAKTQFLLATQHYLRSPLSIIKQFLSLILEGNYGKFPETMREPLSGIQVSINNLIKLVNEFLEVAQLQVGQEILKKKKTDIVELINEILKDLTLAAKEKGLYLNLETPKEKIPEIEIDRTRMKTALFNVIDNGIKYTLKGGVTIKLQIINNKLQIIVKDTGIGIKKEERAGLFERTFERGKEAEKIYIPGRGIGLYISKNFIEAHGGRIWVESKGENQGSTFFIELPIE